MRSPVTLTHLTLSDPESSKLRCRKWSKIDTCIVRYCVRVNPDINWFSLQQWIFNTSPQKIANVIPTAAVKQSAKVLRPPVVLFSLPTVVLLFSYRSAFKKVHRDGPRSWKLPQKYLTCCLPSSDAKLSDTFALRAADYEICHVLWFSMYFNLKKKSATFFKPDTSPRKAIANFPSWLPVSWEFSSARQNKLLCFHRTVCLNGCTTGLHAETKTFFRIFANDLPTPLRCPENKYFAGDPPGP